MTFNLSILGSHVPPRGPSNPKIAIIGEIPGLRENAAREPFVGPSGLVLENCLLSAGIQGRDSVLLDNAVPFYYKSLPKLLALSGATEQFLVWAEELRSRLRASSAQVIIPVGNAALEALTGETGIHKWRGSILESKELPGKKIIPTLHPAVTFRDFAMRNFIIMDFERALRESAFKEIRRPNRALIIAPSL